jgi:hypothetical protein
MNLKTAQIAWNIAKLPFLGCKNGRYSITPRVINAPARVMASTTSRTRTITPRDRFIWSLSFKSLVDFIANGIDRWPVTRLFSYGVSLINRKAIRGTL